MVEADLRLLADSCYFVGNWINGLIIQYSMALIECKYCGAQISDKATNCPKCGKPVSNGESEQSAPVEVEQNRRGNKLLYAIIGVLIVALGGLVCLYVGEKQNNKQLVDENLKYYKESISRNSLLPMEAIIDLYKSNNKEHIRQTLKENGYSLFNSEEDTELWTKNVQLKAVTDFHGVVYEPTEKKGGSVNIYYGSENIYITVSVYSDEDFNVWEKQLQEMGYKEKKDGEALYDENGWTVVGAHGNLCKFYQDSKGNEVEFMKDGDGHPGYDVYSISTSE